MKERIDLPDIKDIEALDTKSAHALLKQLIALITMLYNLIETLNKSLADAQTQREQERVQRVLMVMEKRGKLNRPDGQADAPRCGFKVGRRVWFKMANRRATLCQVLLPTDNMFVGYGLAGQLVRPQANRLIQ
jgi:hypothetical protein